MHQEIYERLNHVASAQDIVYYSEIAPMVRLNMANADHRVAMGKILEKISTHEHQQDRPMLSAIVINYEAHIPGTGFFDLARRLGKHSGNDDLRFFLRELRRVHDYWRDK